MKLIPVVETERLILSKHEINDFPSLARVWASNSVAHFITGVPSTDRESWMRMLTYGGLWPLLGFGYWAVRDKVTGLYLGDLGFADFHRVVEPSVKGIPEAGWVIAPEHHGQGYATEAMKGALDWLKSQNKFEQTICFIDPENTASLRVAKKVGYIEEKEVFMNGSITILLRQKLN